MAIEWNDVITAGITKIKAAHINEIRTLLDNHLNLQQGHPIANSSTTGLLSAADWVAFSNASSGGVGVQGVGPAANSGITTSGTSNITVGLSVATSGTQGAMSAADKTKLDTYPANYSTVTNAINARGTVTNVSTTTPSVTITNQSTTPSISIADASPTQAGLLSVLDKIKLDAADGFPVGTIIMWHGDSSKFNEFFDALGNGKAGTAFAKWAVCWSGIAGNLSTIDMREVFPFGASHFSDSKRASGTKTFVLNGQDTEGAASHTLKGSETGAHRHINGTYTGAGNNDIWNEMYTDNLNYTMSKYGTIIGEGGGGHGPADNKSIVSGHAVVTSQTIFDSGNASVAHNNMPPFIRLYFLYKHIQ